MKNNKKTTVAIMYDFDKTLCTKDMQEYTFIPNVGMTAEAFWAEAKALATERKMDGVLTYMYLMLEKSHAARRSIRRDDFVALGKDLEFFPGVTEWFERIRRFGEEIGVTVEHYIISSGLREIIEGSEIFNAFREVFACEFLYDENGVACWPKNAVNYTTKTQFLFRINKGVLAIPATIGPPPCAARVSPAPAALPARFQPQCPPPRAQLGSPPPPPPEADSRPTPPAFAPPLHGPGTFPASSVHARVGAGCRSMGDVSGA